MSITIAIRTMPLYYCVAVATTIFLLQLVCVHSVSVECGEFSNNYRNCTVEIVEGAPTNTLVFDASEYLEHRNFIFFQSPGTIFDSNFYDSNNRIYTQGAFDRETMVTASNSYNPVIISVIVTGVSSPTLRQTILLHISVLDLDDSVPRFRRGNQFVGSELHLTPSESPNINTILTVSPIDFDEGENGTARIELIQPHPPAFNKTILYNGMRPTTVYIKPLVALDRENRTTYSFQLVAYEGTDNPSNVTLNVSVTVQDINDNLPNFDLPQYRGNTSERSPNGTELLTVHATDLDIGPNAVVRYSIVDVCTKASVGGTCSDLEVSPFVLDRESGVLELNGELNYEETVEYRLTVAASNPNSDGSSTALVNIEVIDVNDNPPEVTDFSVVSTFPENSGINSTYATFRVRDRDSAPFSIFRLSLLANDTLQNSTVFGLQKSLQIFSVVLLQPLDRETRDRYDLIIMAEDVLNTSLFTTHDFTVNVADVNDHYPEFQSVPDPVTLEESSPNSTLVIQVSATDDDIGSNADIRYILLSQTESWPYQNRFTIEPVTGKILVASVLDRETTPTMSILVQARDNGGSDKGKATNLTLNISLTDINDNAPIITTVIPSQLSIAENATVGSLIIDIDATDADEPSNAELTYSISILSPVISNPPFKISSTNGRITVNGSLDHETTPQYSVRLSVSDGGDSPTQQTFTLNVQDVNDNFPSFSNNYYKTLHENVTVGTHVVTVVANDADSAQVTNLTYFFVVGSPHFHLNATSGIITTATTLDWETQSMYSLVIGANDGFGKQSQINAVLNITVIDANDEIPKFVGTPYIFMVAEGTGSDAYVGQVTVKSIEQNDNGAPLFFIDTSDTPFKINQTGAIFTTANLNREDTAQYSVVVRVEDVAPPPHYNTTTVTIHVSDINDNAPVFSSSIVQLSLSEIQAVNSVFYTAHATDMDIAPNNVTEYSLSAPNAGFQIHPETGELSLTSSLNYEVQQSVQVTVIARDQGNPNLFFDTLVVNITVLDDNNTNITFPANFPLQYHLPEDTPLDYVLLNFTGEDHKGNPKLYLNYYLTNESGVTPLEFGIERESSTGYALLTVAAGLDREVTSAYVLNITITDDSTPPSTVTQFLTIRITDINDNSPSFLMSSYAFSIVEERPGQREIGTVTAMDPDDGANGTVTYSLQNTMSGLFSIAAGSGVISQERSLDRETQANYTLTAVASDQGNPSKQSLVSVTVTVTDINDNYPSFTPTQVSIAENVVVGTVVTTLVGHDDDVGSNGDVTFTHTQGSDALSHFELLPNGTILVTQVPDYEIQTEFIFYVLARDGGQPSLQTNGNITIRLTDLNDNCPMFLPPASQYNFSVPEDTAIGSTLINITADDLDQGMAGTVKYVFENIADSGQFELEGPTGLLMLGAALDYEVASHHEVGILAYDLGRPRNRICRQTLYISVENINEYRPIFDASLFIFFVNEELPSGTEVATMQGYDSDANSVLTYSLSNVLPSEMFAIDSNTGQLTTLASLDYESVAQYNMTVTVTDEGGRSSNAVAYVLINNVNDNNPTYLSQSPLTANVSEVATNGTVVTAVIASDADNLTNAAVTYSIVGGNKGHAFRIDPQVGEIFVNSSLDYETTEQYVLTIIATDTGSPSRSASTNVIVDVLNFNEYAPQFLSSFYSFNLTEESPIGTVVGQVVANDSDTGSYGNVRYSLQSLTSLFTISESTGTIRTLVSIDRETTPSLSSLVVAADDMYRTTTVNVTVILVDINDNPPVFPENLYEFSVDLSSPVGTVIGTTLAVDPDLESNTLYFITNTQSLPIAINSSTGALNVSQVLEAVNAPYEFTVVATDSGNSSFSTQTHVRVYVTSDNDHYPNFTQRIYHVSMTENLVPSQPIITSIRANDPDIDFNGLVRYSFSNGSLTQNQFSINSLSGDISLTQPLDYEQAASHDLLIYATDSTPSHPRSVSAHVLVTVINTNDNAPDFSNFPSSVTLSYVPYVDLQLLQLSATDADDSPVTFVLWTQTDKFSIDSTTGILSNMIVLNTTVSYNIDVRVTDGNYTTSRAMSLSIVSPPVNAPSFNVPSISLSVPETTGIGKTITTFYALNSPTEYHLVCCEAALTAFSINTQTGVFSAATSLDFETAQEYELVVEARKVVNGARYSDYQQVFLSVININEFTPRFAHIAPITVNENTGQYSLIRQVSASDSDSGNYGNLTYQIIDGNTNSTFSINSANGALTVAAGKMLDRENVSRYSLVIRAMDGGGKQNTMTLTIIVQDENDSPPTFPGDYSIEIYEPGTAGDRVLKVTASDPDADSTLTYQLGTVMSYLDTVSKGISAKFAINSSTGVISLAGTVNFEQANRYIFTVTVSDSQHTATTQVTVNVLDVNDQVPVFQQSSYQPTFHELSSPGTSVVTVGADDVDSFRYGALLYSLGEGWPEDKFMIDPYGGTVRVKNPMTIYELEGSESCEGNYPFNFQASVYASDGLHNDSTSVVVTVESVNKVAPVFIGSPYNVIVSETTAVGAAVIEDIVIVDTDCAYNRHYLTTFPNYYYPSHDLFLLSNVVLGVYELKTKKTLPQGVYHFRIEAYNNGPIPQAPQYYKARYAPVTITVLPNNTNAPQFNLVGPLSIFENSALATEIGYITASDADLGVSGRINYFLNDISVPFAINNVSGLLSVNGPLDYETQKYYNFQVIASDNGYPVRSAIALVEVEIIDRDDNRPIFTKTEFAETVLENTRVNTTVLMLSVTDADSVVSVRYSIVNSTTGLPFRLDPETGVLTISGSIDFETTSRYILEVLGSGVTNSAMNSSALVNITVEGVNEFAPILPSLKPITVSGNLRIGDVVTTVEATDGDRGDDGRITYEFYPPSPYLIALSNGSILLNVSLLNSTSATRQKRQENSSDIVISMTVVATDAGNPPKNDTGKLTIIIPESAIAATPSSSSLTTEIVVIMSSVAGSLVLIILIVIVLISAVISYSHKLTKKKLDLNSPPNSRCTVLPRGENTDTGGVELQQIRATNSATPTKTVSNNRLNINDDEQNPTNGQQRHSPHTRSTSDLASSVATDTLNLTQEAAFPYSKVQIEAIYAANADLLHDGSQASVHTFGSEGGGESDGDELDNLYYTKYSELDVEGSLIGGEDDMSSHRNSMISESSDGGREEEEYHFSQSTNPWSSRNDLTGEGGSHALLYHYNHSQGVVPPYGGVSTQGSNTSLLRGHRPHYRGGSERDFSHHHHHMYPSSHHHHRVPHPPSNYEYFSESNTPPVPMSLHSRPRRYHSPVMGYRSHSSIPRGLPPPPYLTQDPMPHSLTQGSSHRENYYSHSPEPMHDPSDLQLPYERQTLSTSSTSLSTSASHPYRGRGYP